MKPFDDNAEQYRFWNELAGPLWVANQDEMDRLTGPFGDAALANAAPRPGERVLDVGCGCGSTTLALARAVGATGAVLGADMSAVMLQRAAEQVASADVGNVTLQQKDAQHDALGTHEFDLVFSRFGVMFFADPFAAFANLASALRPAGRVVFTCWQGPGANPWMSLPERAAMAYFELEPPAPGGPGPFSLADPDHITSVLERAGFRDIAIEPAVRELTLSGAGDLHGWAEHRLVMGSTRKHYLESSPEQQLQARSKLIEAVAEHHGPEGLRLPGAAWVVSALR